MSTAREDYPELASTAARCAFGFVLDGVKPFTDYARVLDEIDGLRADLVRVTAERDQLAVIVDRARTAQLDPMYSGHWRNGFFHAISYVLGAVGSDERNNP